MRPLTIFSGGGGFPHQSGGPAVVRLEISKAGQHHLLLSLLETFFEAQQPHPQPDKSPTAAINSKCSQDVSARMPLPDRTRERQDDGETGAWAVCWSGCAL